MECFKERKAHFRLTSSRYSLLLGWRQSSDTFNTTYNNKERIIKESSRSTRWASINVTIFNNRIQVFCRILLGLDNNNHPERKTFIFTTRPQSPFRNQLKQLWPNMNTLTFSNIQISVGFFNFCLKRRIDLRREVKERLQAMIIEVCNKKYINK